MGKDAPKKTNCTIFSKLRESNARYLMDITSFRRFLKYLDFILQ